MRFEWECPECGLKLLLPDSQATGVTFQCVCKLGVKRSPAPTEGPGTELKAMLLEINATPPKGCTCKRLMRKMNHWGVEGCRANRQRIVAGLKANAEKFSLTSFATASFHALTASWRSAIRLTDRWGSLVDEAIRRAEAKQDPPAAV